MICKKQAITNPINTIMSVKRFMGHKWDEVTMEAGHWSYKLVKGDNDTVKLTLMATIYTTEISAMILQKMKKTEDYLGQEVTVSSLLFLPILMTLRGNKGSR